MNNFNIAQYLPEMARTAPERAAVVCTHRADARGRTALNFRELNQDSDRYASGLSRIGIEPEQRVLLMVWPGLEFITLAFALFKLGAVPVLIDPGMGKKNLFDCIRQSRPDALVAVPRAHAARVLSRHDAFKNIRIHVTVGRRWFWGGFTLKQVDSLGEPGEYKIAATTRESSAAILFTTGSTGVPKGVLYTHGMFRAQVESIRQQYGIEAGEVDLAAFPLFALFDSAFGTTCIIPDMDPTRPAECDPEKIVRAIQTHKVTYTFGSPAIWKRVGPYCLKNKISLPSLKRILMAGAPIRGEVLAPFPAILGPNADTHIPYGATEALPMTSIRGSEVLSETWALTQQGKGHCVGTPLNGISVRIIAADNDSCIWDESRILPQGQIGEIVVQGAMVTHEYFDAPGATRLAKITEPGSKAIWHRMGDMGYIDEKGRLWFCGRKAHRVRMKESKTLYSVCVEALFEEGFRHGLPPGHQDLQLRAALVGVGTSGNQRPVILFEDPYGLDTGGVGVFWDVNNFVRWWQNNEVASEVEFVDFYGRFPVDIRHNAKINREQLALWATHNFTKFRTFSIRKLKKKIRN